MGRIQSLILRLIPDFIGHKKCNKEKTQLENDLRGAIELSKILTVGVRQQNAMLKREVVRLTKELKEARGKK